MQKFQEKIFAERDAFLEFEEVSDEEEKVDRFVPKSYIGKPSAPNDSRLYKSLINTDSIVESTQDFDSTTQLESKQNDEAVFVVNHECKPRTEQDCNYENTKAADDQNAASFKIQDYLQKQSKNEVELPRVNRYSNSKISSSAVPKYGEENEPSPFQGYMKKTADYAECDATDSTAAPNYLHKTDLTDTADDNAVV